MTRIIRLAVVVFAMFAPTLASAQSFQMVYRPELRTTVLVPNRSAVEPVRPSRSEAIAMHEAMIVGYHAAVTHNVAFDPADHCYRAIAGLKKGDAR